MHLLKGYLFCLIALTLPSVASAWINVHDLNIDWGDGIMAHCQDHALTNIPGACIGASRQNSCKTWDGQKPLLTGKESDQGVMLMLVARKINKNGAYFCPTQIESRHTDKKANTVVTLYNDPADFSESECFWLCKGGFTGSECKTAVSDIKECNKVELDTTRYNDTKVSIYRNDVEGGMPILENSTYNCLGNVPEEHDIILAVDHLESGGHGAFVRQFVILAHRIGWPDMNSSIVVYPAKQLSYNGKLYGESDYIDISDKLASGDAVITDVKPMLICTNGYEPNSSGTLCVPIDACANTGNNGNNDGNNGNNDGNNNSCDTVGYGYNTDGKCVKCTGTAGFFGITSDRQCVKCTDGKIYDKVTETCITTKVVTKTNLLYGNGVFVDGKTPCWELAGVKSDYKKCVLGKIPSQL